MDPSEQLQLSPFAQARPRLHGQPLLGGMEVLLAAQAKNTNLVLPHTLGRIPRGIIWCDIGAQAIPPYYGEVLYPPFPRGTTAWSSTQFSLSIPTLAAVCWGILI